MNAERSVDGQSIEEAPTIRDTDANWPDGRVDMILELFAAACGLTIPGV